MKTYIVIFNKEISDTDKLFGFQIMNANQIKKYMSAVKQLENDTCEFEMCGNYYEYSYADFEIQYVTQSDLNSLSKFFEIDYDSSTGNSIAIGAFPNAIEQMYDEYPNYDEDETEEESYDEEYWMGKTFDATYNHIITALAMGRP